MSLAEDLATAPKRAQYGARCGFCAWFAGLDKRAQQLVVDALADPAREGATLDGIWTRHGLPYTRGITQRHRRNECRQWARERSS